MIESIVQFRYVEIQTEHGEIPAICLGYKLKKEAEKAFSVLHEYFITPGGFKSLSVVFKAIDFKEYAFALSVKTPHRKLNVHIEHVEKIFVEKIRNRLKSVLYYVILAGYEHEGEFLLLPPKDFHVFKGDIMIDDTLIVGVNKVAINWIEVFKERV